MDKKKSCKIIKTGVYYGYEYKEGEVYEIVSLYGPYFVFILRYDPVDDERYNRMIDWKDVEID